MGTPGERRSCQVHGKANPPRPTQKKDRTLSYMECKVGLEVVLA